MEYMFCYGELSGCCGANVAIGSMANRNHFDQGPAEIC